MATHRSPPKVKGPAPRSRPGTPSRAGAPQAPKRPARSPTEDDNGVAVTASTTETSTTSPRAAGAAVGVGIGLDVLVNIVTDTTHATIDDASVAANGASA